MGVCCHSHKMLILVSVGFVPAHILASPAIDLSMLASNLVHRVSVLGALNLVLNSERRASDEIFIDLSSTLVVSFWRDEGRRDDGELGAQGNRQGRQEHGGEATQRRPQDALRPVSASTGSQRRSLHVLDDQPRGARVQENKGAIARPLATGGDQGQGTQPWSIRDSGLHGLVASAVGERQHSVSGQRNWCGKSEANVGRFGTGGGIRSGTPLQASQSVRPSSEPSRTRRQRGTTPRTHSWGTRTNRSESSSWSSSKRIIGTGIVSSDRT